MTNVNSIFGSIQASLRTTGAYHIPNECNVILFHTQKHAHTTCDNHCVTDTYSVFRLSFDRSELDNLQKSRIQRHYTIDFAIELEFEPYTYSKSHNLINC